ncbi:MAG: hypothetical protein LBG42_06905, partial [Treponema sp.]|nr:hypothetical protein [Treponema sp.]
MMGKKELGRLVVIQGAVDGTYTVRDAAARLKVQEGIPASYATVCRILNAAGIPSNRTHRGGGKRFKRRARRSRFGELLQADATPFDWFGTGERSALHGFIDDATGKIIALYLCKNEC